MDMEHVIGAARAGDQQAIAKLYNAYSHKVLAAQRQKKREQLSLDDIKRIMQSRCITSRTTVGLEGGEFILHPQADEIMAWFHEHHPNYTLLTNGLAPQRVIDAVKYHRPRHLYVSLDGDKETYKRMRGCDGYDKVIELVETLKDVVPLSLMFCLSPWNSFKDMEHVINTALHYGIDVRIGIYGTMAFFDTTSELLTMNDYTEQIPSNIHKTQENYDFVALYDQWRRGSLQLRCQSIMSSLVIHSNGDVPLCQNLDVKLGNIHNQSLDDIFNGYQACETQCRYSKQCNGCWINFHRKYDIILMRNFERLLPKRLIEHFYGPYQWTNDPKITYRKLLKS